MKILIVRKMSALEYYYKGNHQSQKLKKSAEDQNKNLKNIKQILEKNNVEYKVITRRELSKKLVDGSDFVFSAGGDGTVIAVAAFNKNTPQLNLRTDKKSRGKLCVRNIKKAINAVLNENYELEKWTRQDVYLNRKFIGRVCNETCVGENLKFSKMARYDILSSKNSKVKRENHSNSGLIIVTGNGSTGWPSAFSPYSKKSKLFKFKTIEPYEGRKKGEGDYFKIKYLGHEGKFALDTIEYDLPRDSILEIKISKNPLLIVVPK